MTTTTSVRYSYLALFIAGCVGAWSCGWMEDAVSRTLESASPGHPYVTNGLAIIRRYGLVLYFIPVGLILLYLFSPKYPILQESFFLSLTGSVMALVYLFTCYLMLTPFIHVHQQLDPPTKVLQRTAAPMGSRTVRENLLAFVAAARALPALVPVPHR